MALGFLDRWMGIKLDDSLIPTLQEMFKDSGLPNALLFNRITNLMERDGIEVQVVRDSSYADIASTAGNTKPMKLKINPCRLMASLIPEGSIHRHEKLLRIVTHELVHEITSKVVSFGTFVMGTPDAYHYREGERTFIKQVVELYDAARQYLEKADDENNWYGLVNKSEFVAEALSNPDFQKLLSRIPYQSEEDTVLGELFSSIAAEDSRSTI